MSTPELSSEDVVMVNAATAELFPALDAKYPGLCRWDVLPGVVDAIQSDQRVHEHWLKVPAETLRSIRTTPDDPDPHASFREGYRQRTIVRRQAYLREKVIGVLRSMEVNEEHRRSIPTEADYRIIVGMH